VLTGPTIQNYKGEIVQVLGNMPQANRHALAVFGFTAPSRAARNRRGQQGNEFFQPLNRNLGDIVGDPSAVGELLGQYPFEVPWGAVFNRLPEEEWEDGLEHNLPLAAYNTADLEVYTNCARVERENPGGQVLLAVFFGKLRSLDLPVAKREFIQRHVGQYHVVRRRDPDGGPTEKYMLELPTIDPGAARNHPRTQEEFDILWRALELTVEAHRDAMVKLEAVARSAKADGTAVTYSALCEVAQQLNASPSDSTEPLTAVQRLREMRPDVASIFTPARYRASGKATALPQEHTSIAEYKQRLVDAYLSLNGESTDLSAQARAELEHRLLTESPATAQPASAAVPTPVASGSRAAAAAPGAVPEGKVYGDLVLASNLVGPVVFGALTSEQRVRRAPCPLAQPHGSVLASPALTRRACRRRRSRRTCAHGSGRP
jgi:hypothetical protein